MGAAYGTRKGLYRHGLRADALVSLPRHLAAADPTTDTFTLRGHGLSDGDVVTFEARGGTLPAGLSASTPYVVARISSDLFQVTLAGIVADITTAGSAPFSLVLDLDQAVDDALRMFSRHIDDHLPAHATPFTDITEAEQIELWLYWLVAYDLVVTRGLGNPAYKDSAAALADRAKLAQAKLDEKKTRVQTVAGAVDRTPGVVENAPRAVSAGDRGWDNGGRL
jgi:hypothetical protein